MQMLNFIWNNELEFPFDPFADATYIDDRVDFEEAFRIVESRFLDEECISAFPLPSSAKKRREAISDEW